MKVMMLRTMLYMLPKLLARSGRKFPVQAAALARHDATVQIQTMDGVASRWYRFKGGRITSGAGILPDVDVRVLFKDVRAYKDRMRVMQQEALDRMADDARDLGLEY